MLPTEGAVTLRAGQALHPTTDAGRDFDVLRIVLARDLDIAMKRDRKASLWVDRVWSTCVLELVPKSRIEPGSTLWRDLTTQRFA
jgi:hypothetical protein